MTPRQSQRKRIKFCVQYDAVAYALKNAFFADVVVALRFAKWKENYFKFLRSLYRAFHILYNIYEKRWSPFHVATRYNWSEKRRKIKNSCSLQGMQWFHLISLFLFVARILYTHTFLLEKWESCNVQRASELIRIFSEISSTSSVYV